MPGSYNAKHSWVHFSRALLTVRHKERKREKTQHLKVKVPPHRMIRGSCYIPPPFPWLHQWDTVREVQQTTGIHKWTVSSVSDNNMNKTIESTSHDGVEVDCSDDEATILVPNEFILDRLQNTMKKMNNKAKKARKMNRRMKRAIVKDT